MAETALARKTCTRCGVEKPLSGYHVTPAGNHRNIGIGKFKDDVDRLAGAIRYLTRGGQ